MFGTVPPNVDFNSLKDTMTKHQGGWSLLDDPINRLHDGYKYMIKLVKLATPDKLLVSKNDKWDRKKVMEYLDKKKRFLELLMLAMLLTDGQPSRGPELGSIKFRNSTLSPRNSLSLAVTVSPLRGIRRPEWRPITPALSDIFHPQYLDLQCCIAHLSALSTISFIIKSHTN